MVGRTRSLVSPVRLSLVLDAAVELVVASILVLANGSVADLLNLDSAIIWLAAAAFVLAAVGIAAIALADLESRELVWSLAAGNIFAGITGWLAFALFRGELDPGGRWLLTAAADMFIVVGLLEILALRRTPPQAS